MDAKNRERIASLDAYIREHYVEDLVDREVSYAAKPSLPEEGNRPKKRTIPDEGMLPGEDFAIGSVPEPNGRSLDDLVDHLDESFSEMLLRLIDERGLKDADVYKKAGIDRRHFSKIRTDVNYTPGKRTVLAFAVALELSLDETKDLLLRAGYALSMSSKFDVILRFFIENGIYDLFEINEMLDYYGQPLLSA